MGRWAPGPLAVAGLMAWGAAPCRADAAAAGVPTWTIVMLVFLSCLIAVLLVALLLTLRGIKGLSGRLARAAATAAAPSAKGPTTRYAPLGPVDPAAPPPLAAAAATDPAGTVPVPEKPADAGGPDALLAVPSAGPVATDPAEVRAVEELRAAVPPGAGAAYTIFGQPETMDDEFFLRFLRARNFDIPKARDLMLSYLTWRQVHYPSGPPIDALRDRCWRGVVYIDFVDKRGRAVVVLRVKLHDKNWPAEETKNLAVLFLDAALHHTQPYARQLSVLVDLDAFGYSNADLTALKNCLSLLDQCYPERLANLWFLHANFLFMNLWKVVKGFVPPATAAKIHFFGSDFKDQLLENIDAAVLPHAYGGTAPDPDVRFVGRYGPPGL